MTNKEKEPQRQKSIQESLRSAIESKDADGFLEVIQRINEECFEFRARGGGNINALKKSIEDFFDELKRDGDASVEVYLNDGGYSRLMIEITPEGDITLCPSTTSTHTFKQYWENVR